MPAEYRHLFRLTSQTSVLTEVVTNSFFVRHEAAGITVAVMQPGTLRSAGNDSGPIFARQTFLIRRDDRERHRLLNFEFRSGCRYLCRQWKF